MLFEDEYVSRSGSPWETPREDLRCARHVGNAYLKAKLIGEVWHEPDKGDKLYTSKPELYSLTMGML